MLYKGLKKLGRYVYPSLPIVLGLLVAWGVVYTWYSTKNLLYSFLAGVGLGTSSLYLIDKLPEKLYSKD